MVVEEIVEAIHKIGKVSKLWVATRPIEVKYKWVKIECRVVEVAIMVVIRHILI